MNYLKKAPTSVIVSVVLVCGFGFAATLTAFVVLEINGQDTADFRAFVNTLLNLIVLPVTGLSAVAATAAAKSASMAEEQTNGGLEDRIQGAADEAATRAVNRRLR